MAIHQLIQAFNAGELSPLMAGRLGVEKHDVGCRRLENFLPHAHGPISRRPGLEHLGVAEKKARLIGFNYSASVAYAIEVTAGMFRFWRDGSLIDGADIPHPYAEEHIFELQYRAINDVVYLWHADYAVSKLTRVSDASWSFGLVDWEWPALKDINLTDATIAPSATTGDGIALVASADIFQDGHVGSRWAIIHARDGANVELVGAAPDQDDPEAESAFITTVSPSVSLGAATPIDYEVSSIGSWRGTLILEEETAPSVWTERARWSASYDRSVFETRTPPTVATNFRLTALDCYGRRGSDNRPPRFIIEEQGGGARAEIIGTMPPEEPEELSFTPEVLVYDVADVASLPNQNDHLGLTGAGANPSISSDEATIGKNGGTGGYDTQVYSTASFRSGCRLKCKPQTPTLYMMIGLQSGDPAASPSYLDIDYAFLCAPGGTYIYENGVQIATFPESITSTILEIVYDNSAIRYRIDGLEVRTVPMNADQEFVLDSSFNSVNSFYTDLEFGPYKAGARQFCRVASPLSYYSRRIGGPWVVYPTDETGPLRVIGEYSVTSYGLWRGELFLEQRELGGSWEVLRSWVGNYDRNIIYNGESIDEVEVRLRVTDGHGKAASNAEAPRFVLEAGDATLAGLVEITAVTDGQNATADVVRDLWSTDPTELWQEAAWSDASGYPRAGTLHEQRLVFAGTAAQPTTRWGSVSGDFENFRRSSLDDASWAFDLASEQSYVSQWLASHRVLIDGTAGGEWVVRSSSSEKPLTPTTIEAAQARESAWGSSYVQAIIAGDQTVFVSRDGRRLRQISYAQDSGQASGVDLTILAPHITKGGIVQLAYQSAPNSVIWAVTGDGRLISMAYEPQQNVFAWAQHPTNGTVESVATIHGIDGDEVWVSVARTVGGSVSHYIERFHPPTQRRVGQQEQDDQRDAVFVDSAMISEYEEAVATVTGLDHLEGLEVTGLIDGAEFELQTVIAGKIALPRAGKKIIVGLPYTAAVQPMRREVSLNDGSAQGRRWRLSRLTLRVHESFGGRVYPAPTGLATDILLPRDELFMDQAPPLYSGDVDVDVEGVHIDGIHAVFEHDSPLPFTLSAMVLKFDVYGN